MTTRKPNRSGFTLIELLVVIAIIGLLAGLIIPAVMGAVKSAKQAAYKLEVDTLAEAVEKYRSKYGDYPPDGSSWTVMERHLRKAFPQILQSEINLLNPAATATSPPVHNHFAGGGTSVMDPPEALVFFLGGFSADPQRPFTGTGGPFVSISGVLQYNVQRSSPFFEFKTSQLSLDGSNVSTDDAVYFGMTNDLLPVYLSQALDVSETAPFVYFDSRTYAFGPPANPVLNFYQRAPSVVFDSATPIISDSTNPGVRFGAIRPVVSDKTRKRQSIGTPTKLDWLRANLFVNDQTFQIIGPGSDGIYGGRLGQEVNTDSERDFCEALFVYPYGTSFVPAGVTNTSSGVIYDRWKLLENTVPKDLYRRSLGSEDNAGNFSERTFATSVPVGS
jgi:prepilin-type N-terminal cleavage/methylation domain-containing protein